jgi:hypothetical protein
MEIWAKAGLVLWLYCILSPYLKWWPYSPTRPLSNGEIFAEGLSITIEKNLKAQRETTPGE